MSGASASSVVKIMAAPVGLDYLAIENNLSEIAAAEEDMQEAARDNLGLGELSTKDNQSAVFDVKFAYQGVGYP